MTHTPQNLSAELDALISRGGGRIWRGRAQDEAHAPVFATGHAALDELLPGGGWPRGAVTELLLAEPANGELRLLLPVMRSLSQAGRWISWINTPAIPYAPALGQAGLDLQRCLWLPELPAKSAWWAAEQLAHQASSGLVLAWLEPLNSHAIRRLQLALEAGGGMAILCRGLNAKAQSSAAALRLVLQPEADGLKVTMLKSRGNLCRQTIKLP